MEVPYNSILGTLFEQMCKGQQNEEQCVEILLQIASGLDYLHSISIVHRDIKPENILRIQSNDHIVYKITDFGLSTQKDQLMTTKIGTAYYVAPEIVDGRAEKEGYDRSVDTWALGLMFDEMIHGKPFYDGQTEQDVFLKIRNEPYYVRKQEYSNPQTQRKSIINSILLNTIVREPSQRKSLAWVIDQVKLYHKALKLPLGQQFFDQPVDLRKQWSNPNQCSIHKLPAQFRMPKKTGEQSCIVLACIKCLKSLGVYDIETIQRKVDEVLKELMSDKFDKYYQFEEIKEEINQMRIVLLQQFSGFTIRDEHLQQTYEAIFCQHYQSAKLLYQNRIKQLQIFKDNNYRTSDKEEYWIVYAVEQVQETSDNEFLLCIMELIDQHREQAVEECKNLMLELLSQAADQLQSL